MERRVWRQRATYPEIAGYWQTWNLPGDPTLPLACVPREYTDVLIAFAAPDQEGVLRFSGPTAPTKQDVCCLRERGQNVLLSIGGGGVVVTLDTPSKVARFSDSLCQLASCLCVNGVDIDVEEGIPAIGPPDNPQGSLRGLIDGLDCALRALPPDFLLTLAPETANLVGGISRYGGFWGNYLPLLLHFGDRVTRVHMQYYNSGPMVGLSGQPYEAGTVDFVVALADAVIRGFPIADTGFHYPGLPSWKTSIGLPATEQAASNGYLDPAQIEKALCMLAEAHRPLGGLMTWSVQWDARNDYAFLRNGIRILRCVR